MSNDVADWTRERVVVTGAGGVLGTALVRCLREKGAKVEALTRRNCDLLDADAVNTLFDAVRPTIVFHLAGWVAGVQGNINFAGLAFYENVSINVNVIEAARRAKVRKVVAAGTTAVYSDEISLPMREDDIWRGAPHGSEGAYAHAKRAMLAQLDAYRLQYGMDFGYMICTNLYGPNDRFDVKYGHVVPSLVARFHEAVTLDRPEIAIWGDGTPTRDFLFSMDAAKAFVAVAESGRGAFNTATGTVARIRDLVETLAETSGYRGEITWDTSKPKGQQSRSYDTSRLLALGWRPGVDLAEGIRQTYRWYDRNIDTVRR